MARFWIGASGWHYYHWKGRFYPEGLPPREWLGFYSGRFSTVELNTSFYPHPLARFLEGVRRLGDHLGPVLFQMPPFFHRTDENVQRLESFLSLLPKDVMHAFEFRHKSWFGEETREQLRRHGVAFCSFDMVGFECPLAATVPYAYMRFHGSEA